MEWGCRPGRGGMGVVFHIQSIQQHLLMRVVVTRLTMENSVGSTPNFNESKRLPSNSLIAYSFRFPSICGIASPPMFCQNNPFQKLPWFFASCPYFTRRGKECCYPPFLPKTLVDIHHIIRVSEIPTEVFQPAAGFYFKNVDIFFITNSFVESRHSTLPPKQTKSKERRYKRQILRVIPAQVSQAMMICVSRPCTTDHGHKSGISELAAWEWSIKVNWMQQGSY